MSQREAIASEAPAAPPPDWAAPAYSRELEPGMEPVLGLLTTRGLTVLGVALPLLALSVAVHYPALFGMAIGLLATVLADVITVRFMPRLIVRRRIDPPVVERHAECVATVVVSGRRPLLGATTLADQVAGRRVSVAWAGDVIRYPIPTQHRGLLSVGPLRVNRVGAFGLASAGRTQGTVEHVRVLPRAIPIHELPPGRRRSAIGADESMEFGGTDLIGLHEYVPGDDLRRLHWATSARTGSLMVRDDSDPAEPRVTVVLDDIGEHYADHAAAATEFEDAVEMAAALCRAATDRGRPVQLVTVSGAVDLTVGERVGAAEADTRLLTAAFAEIRPAPASLETPDRPGRGPRLPSGPLDTVAVVSGSAAGLGALAGTAARGRTGVVLLVGPPSSVRTAVAATTVTVISAPRSSDLARLWDQVSR